MKIHYIPRRDVDFNEWQIVFSDTTAENAEKWDIPAAGTKIGAHSGSVVFSPSMVIIRGLCPERCGCSGEIR